jgi:hypothetical protein
MLALPVVMEETALRTAEERGELSTQLTLREAAASERPRAITWSLSSFFASHKWPTNLC